MKSLLMLVALCSGPGAMETIEASSNISFATFCLSVAFYLVLILNRKRIDKKWFIAPVILIVVHPYLWLSAQSGDCGYIMRYVSLAHIAIFVLIWAFIFFKKRKTAEGQA